jgi:hypothetical protein
MDGVSEVRGKEGMLVGHYLSFGEQVFLILTDEAKAMYRKNLARDPYAQENDNYGE